MFRRNAMVARTPMPATYRSKFTELAAGDAQQAAVTAHAFKGYSGMLGMSKIQEMAQRLETAIRANADSSDLLAELA
jgi:HPt (histidine-containing phosphotransfer) domain-containing protein